MRYLRYTYPTVRAAYTNVWAGLDTEVNRLFQAVSNDFENSNERFPVDVFSDKENLYVRAELPGFNRDALNVEVVDDQLTVSATQKTSEETKENVPALSRTVTLPESVQTDKVVANYQDGVLTVTLPRIEAVKPRKVAVNVS